MASKDNNITDGGGRNTGDTMSQRRWMGDSTSSALPEFDPVRSIMSIDKWIDKIEEFAVLYEWDDVAIQHFALSKLTGVAKMWRDSLPRAERTWLDWVTLLKDNFPTTSVENILQIKLEAQNFVRAPGQNIIEYFYEKISKCNLAKMDDAETIQWLVRGLGNTRYRDYLGPLTKYERPAELLPHLITANEYIRDKNEYPNGNSNKKFQKVIDTKNNHSPPNGQSAKTSTVICFRCRKVGHTSKECLKKSPVVCFRCSKPGHKSNECRNGKSNTDDTVTSTTQRTVGATNNWTGGSERPVLQLGGETTQNKYFKNAIINGERVQAYIDMGAACVAMRKSEVERLNIGYDGNVCDEFVGYGFGRVKALGSFKTTVIIDGVNAYVPISVVPDEVQEIPLLVGHPFTEQPHIMITSTKNELRVEEIVPDAVVNQNDKTPIWAKEALVIPKNHVGHVSVVTAFPDTDLCIEGGMRATRQMVPRCLISTDGQGQAKVPMVNLSEDDFTIKKGDTVTRGILFAEVTSTNNQNTREINEVPVTVDEIVCDLASDQVDHVLVLLNEYKDLVARNLKQVGCTHLAEMKMILKDDRPVVYRPYRISYKEREQVRDIVDELRNADIVEESESPYASPILLVKKKDGTVRMCVDYRELNKKTVPDKYPLPRIDDQLDRLHGNVYFTSLDLFSGYYQIPINDPKTRAQTSFVTPDGHYQFKRMPFGPTNCPAIFSRMINTALGKLLYSVALAYLDDIIIPSRNVEDGINKLKLVLQSLREAGLTIKLEKCRFFMRKIEYLGFEVSKYGIEPGQRKIVAVEKFPVPNNVRAVRSFIGLASYFRRFVKGFAVIAQPLTDLLCKNARFEWTEEVDASFKRLKEALTSKPILAMYSPEAYTEVHTDASTKGLAAVLMQRQEDGEKMHPVSYYSRKTTKDEAKYHSYELEALAIVCALERFRVYLIGIRFVIKTDCNSLKLLADKRDLSPRIGRWFMKLSEYQYTIEYIKGDRNLVADALSRNPAEPGQSVEVASLNVFGIKITTDWVAALQRDDEEANEIILKIEAKDPSAIDKYVIEGGRVYRITTGRWRLFLPTGLRYDIVSTAHRELSHLGIDKTLDKVKENYYFPKMRDFVTKYVNRCINCMYYKIPRKGEVYWHPLDKGSEPFRVIHLDHLGPFVMTTRDNKYILTIVDGFSKYVVLRAVKDVTANETIYFVREFVCTYGKPDRVITDRGTAFTAAMFEQFCRELNIIHVKVSSKSPRSNGQAEIINGVALKCLSMTTTDPDNADWDLKLMEVQWAINNSKHRVTNCKPFSVVYKHITEGIHNNPLTREIAKLNEEKGNTDGEVDPTEHLRVHREKEIQKIAERGKVPEKFQKGDLVLVRWEAPATGQSRKLEPKYKGPYQVTRELRFDRYVVSDIEGEQKKKTL